MRKLNLFNQQNLLTTIVWVQRWLDQYRSDVQAISKDAFIGVSTTVSCKISGLEAKATVTWKKGDQVIEGTSEGTLEADKTQTSTLTVASPQDDEVYTCLVTSGKYTSSAQSETTVKINTFCKYPFGTWVQLILTYLGLRVSKIFRSFRTPVIEYDYRIKLVCFYCGFDSWYC